MLARFRSRLIVERMTPSRFIPLLVLAFPAFADVTVPANETAGISRAAEIHAVHESSASLKGKLIKLTFVCRAGAMSDLADGGKSGEVLDSPTVRQKLDVEVPKEGVKWFMDLPTTDGGGPPITAYGRLATSKFGEPVFKILGTELKTDAKGTRISW